MMPEKLIIKFALQRRAEASTLVTVDASIGDMQISDPKAITLIESIESTSRDLIHQLQSQESISEEIRSILRGKSEVEIFKQLYEWNYGDITQPENYNTTYFQAIPDGPEPFLSILGFAIRSENDSHIKIITGTINGGIKSKTVILQDYINQWQAFNQSMKSEFILQTREKIKKTQENLQSAYFLESLTPIATSTEQSIASSIRKTQIFFEKNNLLEKKTARTSAYPNISELNELGLWLVEFIPSSWAQSKRFKSGNPDISILEKKLNEIRQNWFTPSV